jgi:hypothetical protein
MRGRAVRGAALRACAVAGVFTAGAGVVALIPLPGLVRAAGMLALPCALLAVLRREDRRLDDARDDIRGGGVRPALRSLLLRGRR